MECGLSRLLSWFIQLSSLQGPGPPAYEWQCHTDMPTDPCDGGIFSAEMVSSQVTKTNQHLPSRLRATNVRGGWLIYHRNPQKSANVRYHGNLQDLNITHKSLQSKVCPG